jgi:hypothetical protein
MRKLKLVTLLPILLLLIGTPRSCQGLLEPYPLPTEAPAATVQPIEPADNPEKTSCQVTVNGNKAMEGDDIPNNNVVTKEDKIGIECDPSTIGQIQMDYNNGSFNLIPPDSAHKYITDGNTLKIKSDLWIWIFPTKDIEGMDIYWFRFK